MFQRWDPPTVESRQFPLPNERGRGAGTRAVWGTLSANARGDSGTDSTVTLSKVPSLTLMFRHKGMGRSWVYPINNSFGPSMLSLCRFLLASLHLDDDSTVPNPELDMSSSHLGSRQPTRQVAVNDPLSSAPNTKSSTASLHIHQPSSETCPAVHTPLSTLRCQSHAFRTPPQHPQAPPRNRRLTHPLHPP